MTEKLYHYLYHELGLQTAGIAVGLLMVVGHLVLLFASGKSETFLRSFPRNYNIGVAILAVAFAWTLLVWSWMDLGEFHNLEGKVQIVLVVGFFAVAYYVREFLAVRATGFLLLLAAGPLLHAAFQEPPVTRLFLVALCFVWIIIGMFWVGMPYLMRDHIKWALATPGRFKAMAAAGLAYGLIILGLAVFQWQN